MTVAGGSGARHLAGMPLRPRPEPAQQPSEGGYAVFHEWPYPHRLDRVFRVAAVVVGAALGIGSALVLHLSVPNHPTGPEGWLLLLALSAFAAGMAYGLVRAVGMIVVGIYGGTRPKQYVVDWEDRPPS